MLWLIPVAVICCIALAAFAGKFMERGNKVDRTGSARAEHPDRSQW